jgi:segregation and condensation protein B
MGVEEDCRLLEAALYAREGFLSVREAKKVVGTSSETYLKKLVERLAARLEERKSPFKLIQSGQVLSLRLRESYLSKLEGFIPKVRLSKGVLKTLSLLAYKQPILQSELVKARGKRIYDHLRLLEALGFVEVKSYQRTKVLRTTQKFSSYFGLEGDIETIPLQLEKEGKLKGISDIGE